MQKQNKKNYRIRARIASAFLMLTAAFWLTMSQGTLALAEGDTSAITKPLDNLKTLVVAVIGAVGLIILCKNVMEYAQAFQASETSTMNSALKGIVAGAIMAGISAVITFLGF